jgi:D-glycero-beta-D-manno-heptose 1-phosphate adenylyltransferase
VSPRRAPGRPAPAPGSSPDPAPIVGLAEARRRVAAARRARPAPRIVLANGLFDLLHVGHLRYLSAARRQGDLLVVAVNDDRSARALRGAGRPLVPARDRARLVAAVRGVGMVLLFGGSTVTRVLLALRPDVHCKGTDYTPGTVPERAVVRGYGGTVRVVGDRKRHASSDLIGRMAARG